MLSAHHKNVLNIHQKLSPIKTEPNLKTEHYSCLSLAKQTSF